MVEADTQGTLVLGQLSKVVTNAGFPALITSGVHSDCAIFSCVIQ